MKKHPAGVVLAFLLFSACEGAPPSAPLVEIDHVYVVVPDYRVAVEILGNVGLTMDTVFIARHEGGGTASVSADFENAYLEILWVDSAVSVAENAVVEVEGFRKAAGWKEGGPSPFGVGLRRTADAPDSLPYAGEILSPEWAMEDGSYFSLEKASEDEPSIFIVPASMTATEYLNMLRSEAPELLEHALGISILSAVSIGTGAMPAAAGELGLKNLEFRRSDLPVMALTFDQGRQGGEIDLRPGLPLVLRY